ncbi:MAG: hypothetical protein ACR2PG_24425, partial [Hyphomicrobiaceae bacterium]
MAKSTQTQLRSKVIFLSLVTFFFGIQGGGAWAKTNCKLENQQMRQALNKFRFSITKTKKLSLGVPVRISWQNKSATFPKHRNVEMYLSTSSKIDATGQGFKHYSADDDAYEASKIKTTSGLVVTLNGEGASNSGYIEIRPLQTGAIPLSIKFIATKGWSSKCKEVVLGYFKPRTYEASAPKLYSSPRTCHIRKAGNKDVGPRVKLSVSNLTGGHVEAGQPIVVKWRLESKLDPSCRTPVYLMLTTPMRVRFEGHGFLALPPGAKGPFGLSRDLDQARVFVPLNSPGVLNSGTIKIKPYQAGTFAIDAAVVELPNLTARPSLKTHYAVDNPRVLKLSSEKLRFEVKTGQPRIVVQDRYSTDKPDKTVYSRTGEFELQVFKNRYRVLDVATGELVVERSGSDANFSPGARFVHGLLEKGTAIEIVDLYAGQPIYTYQAGGGQLLSAYVHSVAWGHNDSYFLVSQRTGGADFGSTLIDRAQTNITTSNYKLCVCDTELYVNIDWMAVYFYDPYLDAQSEKRKRVKRGTFFSLLHIAAEYDEKYLHHSDRLPSPDMLFQWPRYRLDSLKWSLGETTRLSFHSDLKKGLAYHLQNIPDYADNPRDRQAYKTRLGRLDTILNRHATKPMPARPAAPELNKRTPEKFKLARRGYAS